MQLARTSTARLRWQAVSVGTGLLAVLAAVWFTPFVGSLNLYVQDWMLRETTRLTRKVLPADFALVTIDERAMALSDLDPEELAGSRPLQLMKDKWPWSREVYAAAAEKLLSAGARLVIFDILFPAAREGDEAFAGVLEKYPGKVVLASTVEIPSSEQQGAMPQLVSPTPALEAAVAGHAGLVNFPPWSDRKVRSLFTEATASEIAGLKTLPGEEALPTLATAAARLLGGAPPENRGPRRFRYALPGSLKIISLHELFVPAYWAANSQDGRFFQDRVVIIGATAERLHDIYPTPWGPLPGPEIQTHALAATMRGDWLGQAGMRLSLITMLAGAVAVFALLMVRRSALWFVTGLLGVALLWLGLGLQALGVFSYFLPMAPPLLSWLVCGFAGLVCDVTLERHERGRLRGMLERYVSKDIVSEIADNPDSFLQTLGGQRKEIVAMFSDLKGFTSASEKLEPAALVALLNEYFGEMVSVVFKHKGTLDKFMGDALMATWGCIQVESPAVDARRAVTAALEMQDRLAVMNAQRQKRGAMLWSSGTGICQGPAIFGNIGSHEKMDLTVIGDTVNLASRVEGLTRIYGCPILVDAHIAANAASVCQFLVVDDVRVKGRTKPEKLFFPHRGEDPAWVEAFASAREKYLAGDFEPARAAFGKLSTRGPAPALAARFMSRCEGFLRVPPDEGWDGVSAFVDK